jgi:hypothetical protein
MTEIILYHFSKRKNSTKRPTGQGTTVLCLLKLNTTFQNPVFKLKLALDSALQYNYLQWADHYYFINSTVSLNNDMVEISASEDVLATYRTEISNYTCFIERSSKQTTLANDSMYIPTNDWVSQSTIVGQPINTFVNGYARNYLLRTISVEGISTYYVTGQQLDDLMQFMYTYGSIQDVMESAITRLLFNPFQYIVDLKWLPFRLSSFLSITDNIKLGYWDSDVVASLINDATCTFSYDLSLGNPLYTDTDFRFYNPAFSKYTVKLPFVGVIPINPAKTHKGQLKATYNFDAVSGMADVWVTSGSDEYAHFQCQLAVPVQIGYATANIGQLTTSLIDVGTSLASGHPVGAVTNTLGAFQSVTSPEPNMVGTVGNISSILNNMEANSICYACTSIDPDGASEGYVDGTVRSISSLSGFVKCRNASIQIAGFEGDQEQVNSYLNSGFYFE